MKLENDCVVVAPVGPAVDAVAFSRRRSRG